MPSYYDILGVSHDASAETIRKAYRDQAKRAHPDVAGTTATMVSLNQAYETLRDPSLREAYDASLRPVRRLPRRAPARPQPGVDPLEFFTRVFQPLDREMRASIAQLHAAIAELAYDLYDDHYIARFGQAIERAEAAHANVVRQLHIAEWPDPWTSALNLYDQGLRQVEDALEDFATFVQNFDADLIVEGRTILAGGDELLSEARERLRLG